MRSSNKLTNDILEVLNNNENIISSSIVGSIIEKDIEDIADIDIVVILDQVTLKKISQIKNDLLNLSPLDYRIKKNFLINDTFGPLKFNDKKTLVFHLMIYDVNSHIEHVIKSPFTCYDWERSNLYIKQKLSEIYSPRMLMFSDFTSTRRSIKSYLEDLENGIITYRKYVNNPNGEIVQKQEHFILDEKHSVEYGYHIIKNTISNLIKIIQKNNIKYSEKDFKEKWKIFFPDNYAKFIDVFNVVEECKKSQSTSNSDFMKDIKSFLIDVYQLVDNTYNEAQKILLVRHLKTGQNDGRFLGQNSDPSIIENQKVPETADSMKELDYITFSSPMKRAIETVEKLGLKLDKKDNRLNEFNYGLAEGKYFQDVIKEFPEITKKINSNEDFKFPSGEDYADILSRIKNFIDDEKDNLICITHQGPLRSLVGEFFNIPKYQWHKIQIPYATPFEVLIFNKEYYLNIDRNLFKEIFKEF